MNKIHPGDIVDITIKGVRVIGVNALNGTPITIADEHGDHYPMPPQAAVERIAPAEWPPRPGDLWRDSRDGGLWFAMEPPAGGVILNGWDGGRHGPEYVNREVGPLTLVHREEGEQVEQCDECESTGYNCRAHRKPVAARRPRP